MKKTIMAIFIFLMAIVAVSAVSYSSCNKILLKTGDSCTADTNEDIEGALLYAHRGKDVHVLEITNINGDLLDFKDRTDVKYYDDIKIGKNNKVRLPGLGTIRISITGTTLKAIDLKLKGK